MNSPEKSIKTLAGIFGHVIAAQGTTLAEFEKAKADGEAIGKIIANQLQPLIEEDEKKLPTMEEFIKLNGWKKPSDELPEDYTMVNIIVSKDPDVPPIPALYKEKTFMVINGVDISSAVLYWSLMPPTPYNYQFSSEHQPE